MKKVLITAAEGAGYGKTQALALDVKSFLSARGVVAHLAIDIDVPEMHPDMVIAVGGDGTIVKAMNTYSAHGVPVVGLNGGDVGFLSIGDRSNYDVALARVLKGDFVIENRTTLQFIYQGKQFGPFLNEVKLWHPDTLIPYDVLYQGGQMYGSNFKSRGVIIATQTGSTAESRSAGHGDVIAPGTEAHALTPLHPYGFNTPPMTIGYLAQGSSLVMGPQRLKYDVPVEIHADGHKLFVGDSGLQAGEHITVSEHAATFQLVTFGLETFQVGLRKKGFAQ